MYLPPVKVTIHKLKFQRRAIETSHSSTTGLSLRLNFCAHTMHRKSRGSPATNPTYTNLLAP
eukprot:CCRYP_018478-RA/>CCRYP_018478-RA protein AED:0.46 eAED:0.55 QI:0/0/0.5/1/0/0/2/517/61